MYSRNQNHCTGNVVEQTWLLFPSVANVKFYLPVEMFRQTLVIKLISCNLE